jgi:hypothetical protein
LRCNIKDSVIPIKTIVARLDESPYGCEYHPCAHANLTIRVIVTYSYLPCNCTRDFWDDNSLYQFYFCCGQQNVDDHAEPFKVDVIPQ